MAVAITTACISCGACVWECPTEAIWYGDPRPRVDADSCTECFGFFGESQCIVVCPAGAITVTAEEDVQELAARFDRLYPGVQPNDTWIWRRLSVPFGMTPTQRDIP